jgi:hypothetical protein
VWRRKTGPVIHGPGTEKENWTTIIHYPRVEKEKRATVIHGPGTEKENWTTVIHYSRVEKENGPL